jgi:hypothetical protein
MDAVRTSLSQLFLTADLVAIARIDSVADREFVVGETATRYEVVAATVTAQYKGDSLSRVEFFQDAHGHAHYQPGDTAVVFLQRMGAEHQLYAIGHAGSVQFVSHQARNTEHRIRPGELGDYTWVLTAYAQQSDSTGSAPGERAGDVSGVLMRMLTSHSRDLMESALLDWENAGQALTWSDAEVRQLRAQTRDPARPIDLRIALLRTLSRRNMAGDAAWIDLLQNEDAEDLLLVLRSTRGFESAALRAQIVPLLENPNADVAEAAARALGHPVYAGAEDKLLPLLYGEHRRLNYAAAAALAGINSERSSDVLREAAADHPDAKIRRMISARTKAASESR